MTHRQYLVARTFFAHFTSFGVYTKHLTEYMCRVAMVLGSASVGIVDGRKRNYQSIR
ncbi:hypothetical protein [Thalassoroseus pseudoceratinae]|uniref:hypothetical protein n=1 Tax=Thalassoroseus pseudoceratinae TaxID=2713176 RepID=UPI0014249EC2|nr:hypothetical protein [Thalassoroseus pseudoceratinae]